MKQENVKKSLILQLTKLILYLVEQKLFKMLLLKNLLYLKVTIQFSLYLKLQSFFFKKITLIAPDGGCLGYVIRTGFETSQVKI